MLEDIDVLLSKVSIFNFEDYFYDIFKNNPIMLEQQNIIETYANKISIHDINKYLI